MSKKLDTKVLDMPRMQDRPHQLGKIARSTCVTDVTSRRWPVQHLPHESPWKQQAKSSHAKSDSAKNGVKGNMSREGRL